MQKNFVKCIREDSSDSFPLMIDVDGNEFIIVIYSYEEEIHHILKKIEIDHCYLIECEYTIPAQKQFYLERIKSVIDYGMKDNPIQEVIYE